MWGEETELDDRGNTALGLEGSAVRLIGGFGICGVGVFGLVRGLIVSFGMFDLEVGGLGLEEKRALVILPDAEEDEGERSSCGPEFCVARDFRFGLPTKKLGGDEKSENGPA